MSQAASSVGNIAKKITSGSVRAAKAVTTGGTSEVKQYVDDQTAAAQRAADEAAQQQAATDSAAANAGPKPVALRDQFFADQAGAAGALRSGNESDIAGTSLFSGLRKRGASRALYGF